MLALQIKNDQPLHHKPVGHLPKVFTKNTEIRLLGKTPYLYYIAIGEEGK